MVNLNEKTIGDSDSPASRENSHENFARFLKKLGIEKMSQPEKVAWLKNIEYEKFMDLLSVANGLLTSHGKFQRWQGEAAQAMVGSAGGSEEDAELDPPLGAEAEFRKLFGELQANISEDNIKKCGAKLYVGIIFSHMFPDGNGRTGRNVYQLMSAENVPMKETTMSRGPGITEFCNRVSLYAMSECFRQEGLPVETIEDIQGYYATQEGMSVGNMSHLQFLAARRVLAENSQNTSGKKIELSDLSEAQRKRYEEEYQLLKNKWWWETQKTVDKYGDWAVGSLDKAILGKG